MDTQTAVKVASLAKLRLADEAEAAHRAEELSGILSFVEQLGEVETEGVTPLANPHDGTQRLREDEVSEGGDTGNSGAPKVLSNAPEQNSDYYVVPKVVE